MNVGFDLDGVISKTIFIFLTAYFPRAWNKLLGTPPGRLLYRARQVDKELREILHQLQAQGHRIVIATYVFEEYEKEVSCWLQRNKIPHDKLVLARKEECPLTFKIRAISMCGCDYFVDDQPSLVRGLATAVYARIILYRRKEDLDVLLRES